MSKFTLYFAGIVLLALFSVLPASAQTLIHSTDWTTGSFGSTTAGAAGTTTGAGDGRIDNAGGVATVTTASPHLVLTSPSSPYANGQYLLDPTSENAINKRKTVYWIYNGTSPTAYAVLRYQGSNNAYLIGGNPNTAIFADKAGVLTSLATPVAWSATPTVGDIMEIIGNASGSNPTTLSETVIDVTTGATLATASASDSTSNLQTAGQSGIMGVGTLSVTKAASYDTTPAAATSYTTALSASTGPTGTPVTLTYTPNGTSTATLTPAVSGVSGTFSPSTVSFNGTAAVTTTFTPTTAGTATLTSTNSAGLTDPAAATYTVFTPVVVGVANAAWHFSPGNWVGDTGRGGSVYRQTWIPGAYASVVWAASASPTAKLNISNQTTASYTSYVLNGVLHDNIATPASGGITLSGIAASGVNTLTVYCRNSNQINRWNEANAWKITDLTLDANSAAGTAAAWNGKWGLEIGDSITEGSAADPTGQNDNLYDYSYLLGQALLQQGYDYSVSACGSEGWINPGDSATRDVPGFYPVSSGTYTGTGRWNMIDANTSLLDSNGHISAYGQTGQEPQLITINLMTNEVLQSLSVSDAQASVTQGLTAVRGAAPNAFIIVYVPFDLYATGISGFSGSLPYINALKAGVSAYQSAHPSDTKMVLADFGTTLASQLYALSATVHPPAPGHAVIAADAGAVVFPKLLAPAVSILSNGGQIKRGR